MVYKSRIPTAPVVSEAVPSKPTVVALHTSFSHVHNTTSSLSFQPGILFSPRILAEGNRCEKQETTLRPTQLFTSVDVCSEGP